MSNEEVLLRKLDSLEKQVKQQKEAAKQIFIQLRLMHAMSSSIERPSLKMCIKPTRTLTHSKYYQVTKMGRHLFLRNDKGLLIRVTANRFI